MTTNIETTETKPVPAFIAPFRAAILAQDPWALLKAAGIKYCYSPERTMYLAYGFLRGLPYRVMEPTARPLFDRMGHAEKPFLKDLSALINAHGGTTTPESMAEWMKVPESPARLSRRQARESKSRAIREAKRQAHAARTAAA